MTLGAITFLLAATLLAGFVQGSIGFGYGLMILSLTGWWLGVRDAAIVTAPAALGVNLFLAWRLRKHFRWERTWPVFVAVVVGAPLGVLFLARSDPRWLNLALGILLLATVAQKLWTHTAKHRWPPVAAGGPVGLLSGALSGAFGTGGPPLVAYVSSQRFDRLRYVATVQMLLALGNAVRIEEQVRRGLLTVDRLPAAGAAVAVSVAGALLGLKLLHRLPEKRLSQIVLVFLFAIGAKYVVSVVSG